MTVSRADVESDSGQPRTRPDRGDANATTTGDSGDSAEARHKPRLIGMLGPAFVAAIAYVDPGNVAANLSAGAEFGYKLLWVLVAANVMAMIVQYLSAKIGLVTGKSLTANISEWFDHPGAMGATDTTTVRPSRRARAGRLAYWGQAEIIAAATDIAEVIGGAIALHLLFGIPPLLGGVIVGVVSMALLVVQNERQQRTFEAIIVAFLVVITIGFLSGLAITGLSVGEMFEGIVPRFQGTHSVILAASMLGATVMPHAVYLHSGLVRDRSFTPGSHASMSRYLHATRIDVVGALVLAGTVNIAMLCLAAQALRGVEGTDSIEGAHAAVSDALGPVIGALFAVGLLASGLASTSVGCYAGDMVMRDLLKVKVPIVARRLITMIPGLIVLGVGIDPTWALVVSQVVLSVGIPFALIPLVAFTASTARMGRYANARALTIIGWAFASVIIALNVVLIWLTLSGQG